MSPEHCPGQCKDTARCAGQRGLKALAWAAGVVAFPCGIRRGDFLCTQIIQKSIFSPFTPKWQQSVAVLYGSDRRFRTAFLKTLSQGLLPRDLARSGGSLHGTSEKPEGQWPMMLKAALSVRLLGTWVQPTTVSPSCFLATWFSCGWCNIILMETHQSLYQAIFIFILLGCGLNNPFSLPSHTLCFRHFIRLIGGWLAIRRSPGASHSLPQEDTERTAPHGPDVCPHTTQLPCYSALGFGFPKRMG